MKLLDLFCGAGGCAAGYARAGFTEIVGIDLQPQKRYPFAFIQGDALEYLATHGHEYDCIHASPPCQAYSVATLVRGASRKEHPDLVGPVRDLLMSIGVPWIIENVEGAPLRAPAVRLCGLMFGLKVFRHRWFESSEFLFVPEHPSHAGHRIGEDGMVCVAGHGGHRFGRDERARIIGKDHRDKASWERGMGIDWMSRDELAQAIPPAYTEYVGRQLLQRIERAAQEGSV